MTEAIIESSKSHFIILSIQLVQDYGEDGKTSELHKYQTMSLDQKQSCVEYHDGE